MQETLSKVDEVLENASLAAAVFSQLDQEQTDSIVSAVYMAGVGGIYSSLSPSLTLGCGTSGKNITTDNITTRHLHNIQRITRRQLNQRLPGFDQRLYFDESMDAEKIEKIFNRNY